MSTSSDTSSSSSPSPDQPSQICPFCGASRARDERNCARCGMEDNARIRRDYVEHIGPWCVLDEQGRSGMMISLNSIRQMIEAGKLRRESVLRGPTTRQLWRRADQTRGISREFGACHSCAAPVEIDAQLCPICHANQLPPYDPWRVIDEAPGEATFTTSGGLPLVDMPSPSEIRAAGAAHPRQSIESPSDLTDACRLDVPRASHASSPGRRRRIMAMVILLIAAGAAVGAWMHPEVWYSAQEWLQIHSTR